MNADFWKGKKVLITGGSGFVGTHIVNKLKQGCSGGLEIQIPRSKDYNLIKYEDAVKCMQDFQPDIVIHLAAFYGGIWINKLEPGRIYFENLVMGANVFEAARLSQVKKLVAIGTACAYPGEVTGHLKESQIWDGPCHESVENYGPVKKMMLLQGRSYKKQYDFNSIHLILTNLYGPGDTYHPDRSHVVAALIRKFVEAKQNNADHVDLWGTGNPVREFLYVGDCAEAIIRAAESYNDCKEALNIGTGVGTSIKELAETIQKITQFSGELRWDTNKPDGAMLKVLDVNKMKTALSWVPEHSLYQGLEKTINWYSENKEEADKRL